MNKGATQPGNPRAAGAFILLAILTLAAIGFYSLRQDERRIIADADALAMSLAIQLSSEIHEILPFTRFSQYDDANGVYALTASEGPFRVEFRMLTNDLVLTSAHWLSAPEIERFESKFKTCLIAKDGSLIFPPAKRNSTPRPFDIPDALRSEWDAAAISLTQSNELQKAIQTYGRIETNSAAPWLAPVAMYHRAIALSQTGNPKAAIDLWNKCVANHPEALSESGLPLAPLARFQAARTAVNLVDADPVKVQTIANLAKSALLNPSEISPGILETAQFWSESLAHNQNLPSNVATAILQWTWHERLRQLHARSTGKNAEWSGPPEDAQLFVRQSATHVDLLMARSFNRLKEDIDAVIRKNRFQGERFGIYVTIAGRSFGRKPRIADASIGGYRREQISTIIPGSIQVYTIDNSFFFTAHRKRQLWFGGVIAFASLIALGGFKSLRDGYLRQILLNEQKSDFVSSVSHELRAPIASMQLMTESLERGKIETPEKQKEYFGFILQECRRLSALIENVLDYARIDQNRKSYEFEPADLTQLVKSAARLMEPQAQQAGIRIDLKLPDESADDSTPSPILDAAAIQQALINLIDNAIKFSPTSSTVTIGVELTSDARNPPPDGTARPIHIWVEDQGKGVPVEDTARIFERFYRSESELRRESKGVGIGLSLVKHIVEAHRGRISVRNAAHKGSRFTIELPLNPDSN